MYNLSNAITCLKHTTKFIVFSVYICIYIPLKPKHVSKGATLPIQVQIQFWKEGNWPVRFEQ
jgi:hypothetical protein